MRKTALAGAVVVAALAMLARKTDWRLETGD
jgi:hypothetical protein